MPRTLGQHFLMHSVENSDTSRFRDADNFDDAKKRHDGPAQEDFNPERSGQHRFIRKYAKRQQQSLGGDNLDQVARENQQQNPDRTQQSLLNEGEMLNAPPQMNRQGQRGQFGQIDQQQNERGQRQDRQQFDRQRQDFNDDQQQDFDDREQGQFDRQQQGDSNRQQFNNRQQGFNRRQELDEDSQDFSNEDSFRELGSARQQNLPSQNKLDLEVQRQARTIGANADILGNEINEEVRNKLPTAAQPKTELTGGKNPWELSDTSMVRRELRDTRIFRDKYDSEEEMHEEGRRQIEARRIPEDVVEGRPSPSNEGRILLLPRAEINGNWRDGQMKQLIEKAGDQSVLLPEPLAPGHRQQAIEDNKFSLQKRGLVRQMDLENKLQEMGEPGRQTTMQEALRWQRNLENMTPEQRAESDERRQREEAGDNKSSADRVAHDGWRILTDPGKMYTQSKEGKEKMQAAEEETQAQEEKQQDEAPKKLSVQDERKEKMKQAHLKHRAFYEELERRRHGMTPLESLDFNHEKLTDFDDQQQTDLASLSGMSIQEARAKVRQDELNWRDQQREGLGVIQRIQKQQELEEREGQDNRERRGDKKFDDRFDDKFKDDDNSRDEKKSGMLGSIKNFASHKWHDLTHSKEDNKQKDEFWGRNERQSQQLDQKQNQQQLLRSTSRSSPPTSPTTPVLDRRSLSDRDVRTEDKFQSSQEQPAKKGWWFFSGNRSNLQHFAPEWDNTGKQNTRFIDSLTDDELSMMSL